MKEGSFPINSMVNQTSSFCKKLPETKSSNIHTRSISISIFPMGFLYGFPMFNTTQHVSCHHIHHPSGCPGSFQLIHMMRFGLLRCAPEVGRVGGSGASGVSGGALGHRWGGCLQLMSQVWVRNPTYERYMKINIIYIYIFISIYCKRPYISIYYIGINSVGSSPASGKPSDF